MTLFCLTPTAHATALDTFPLPAHVVRVGIVPQGAPSELFLKWQPVLAWLSKASGITLEFITAPDVPTFEDRLAQGEYDIAYMNPYHFVYFNEQGKYHAFVRNQDQRIYGIVVVRNDSKVQVLKDLNGEIIAFPTPAAFAATIIVENELQRQHIFFKEDIVKSHNSVYRNVAMGLTVAGGGIPRTLKMIDPDIQNKLRILWQSPPYTPHAMATRTNFDSQVRDKIFQAMQAMNQSEEGRALLQEVRFKGFEPAKDSDWDDIRALGIKVKVGTHDVQKHSN
ncbi:MAG: phosphate/phosphite/phosphonate ABC transporter substrate-binding protein [Zetaproteobacteria bacterium]|nr:phosphate/phosphite/phosphonate ABC transporter substrate-binding protein [Zetaproteobacteria bacterium]